MSQHRLQKRSSWHGPPNALEPAWQRHQNHFMGNLGSALPLHTYLSALTRHHSASHRAVSAVKRFKEAHLSSSPDSKMPGIKQRLFGKYGRKKAPKSEPTHGAASSSSAPTAAKRGRKRALLDDSKLSPFGLHLKSDWLRHRQTGPGVQQYAETAQASGAQALEGLSSAGSEGSNPKNVARDLRRKLMPSTMSNGPPLYYVQDVTEGGSRHPVVLLGRLSH